VLPSDRTSDGKRAHWGARVQHCSRVAADPSQPNLRQLHHIHDALFGYLAERGFNVGAGDLGENITTTGMDLLDLPVGAVLKNGSDALLVATGLRNPCLQIDNFQDGLLECVRFRDDEGELVRLAGIMTVVVGGGVVRPGDVIEVSMPPLPLNRLRPV
jgi:MOSC domain-containing protein YiiM